MVAAVAVALLVRDGPAHRTGTDNGEDPGAVTPGPPLPTVTGPGSFQTAPDGRVAFVTADGGRIEVPEIEGLRLELRSRQDDEMLLYLAAPANPYGLPENAVAGYFNPDVFAVDHRVAPPAHTRLGAVGLVHQVTARLRERGELSWALNVDPTTPGPQRPEMTLQLSENGFQVRTPVGSSVGSAFARDASGETTAVRILPQTEVVTALEFPRALQMEGRVFTVLVAVASPRTQPPGADPGAPFADEEVEPDPGSTLLRVERAAVDEAFIDQMGPHRFPDRDVNVMVVLAGYRPRPTVVRDPDVAFFSLAGRPSLPVHLLSADSPLLDERLGR